MTLWESDSLMIFRHCLLISHLKTLTSRLPSIKSEDACSSKGSWLCMSTFASLMASSSSVANLEQSHVSNLYTHCFAAK